MIDRTFSFLKGLQSSKGLFVLIDPDKFELPETVRRANLAAKAGADAILVGGSLMFHCDFGRCVEEIKRAVDCPVIIFPGLFPFVASAADALLLISMLSSRNPQLLIGEQVQAAPLIKMANLEAIGTAYLLVGGERLTSVQYMSHSLPIPSTKPDIAAAHALAAHYLGFKCLYADAGSGAEKPIPPAVVKAMRENFAGPIILGGGIRTPQAAAERAAAGADIIVTGTVLEENPDSGLINEFVQAVKGAGQGV